MTERKPLKCIFRKGVICDSDCSLYNFRLKEADNPLLTEEDVNSVLKKGCPEENIDFKKFCKQFKELKS